MLEDRRKLAIIVIIIFISLIVAIQFETLSTGEALNALILFFLCLVTAIYAKETRRIAQETRKQTEAIQSDKYGAVHPILSIVGTLQRPNWPEPRWLQTPERIQVSNIDIRNFGPGPAINGSLCFYNESSLVHSHRLPTMGTNWAHIAEIKEAISNATKLIITYEDVFGHKHETIYSLTFFDNTHFAISNEIHKCQLS